MTNIKIVGCTGEAVEVQHAVSPKFHEGFNVVLFVTPCFSCMDHRNRLYNGKKYNLSVLSTMHVVDGR